MGSSTSFPGVIDLVAPFYPSLGPIPSGQSKARSWGRGNIFSQHALPDVHARDVVRTALFYWLKFERIIGGEASTFLNFCLFFFSGAVLCSL